MPELPEVEVICQGLAPQLVGRRILSCRYGGKNLRLPLPGSDSGQWLTGQVIVEVKRRAKFIQIILENQAVLLLHLGMTGRLGIFLRETPGLRHDHAAWLLDDGRELRLNDTRRFGSVQVIPPGDGLDTIFANYGPDPFWETFCGEYLLEKAVGRRLPVKNFLMDNRIVTGIGNIYASEILFAAATHPARAVADLTLGKWAEIVGETRRILTEALECGGTTIADYVNSRGEEGYFQVRLRVYGRRGMKCHKCLQPIEKIRQSGRTTFFCPRCQRH